MYVCLNMIDLFSFINPGKYDIHTYEPILYLSYRTQPTQPTQKVKIIIK